MCHGNFDKETGQYYLDFESETCEVFPFFIDNIN